MNWRELMTEPEGADSIYKSSKTLPKEGGKANFACSVDIVEVSRHPELSPGNDPIGLFKREYRRLSTRLSRVMDADRDRGYLAWVRQHNPELWRSLENARGAWDVNERLEELKAGRIVWRDYRALMLRWARLNVKAIKFHSREYSGSSPGALRGGAV